MSESRARQAVLAGALLTVFLIPRIYSLTRPLLWVEDESYLYCAFLMTLGKVPYLDFPLTHFPMLESILAGCYLAFGASVRTAEFLTQILIFCSTILVYRFAKRISESSVIAFASAIFFSAAPLVLDFHVFAREYFVIIFVLSAGLLGLDEKPTRKKTFLAGFLLTLAMLSKLTAFAFVFSHILFLFFRKQKSDAIRTGAIVVLLLCTSIASGYLLYGRSFLAQTFLFGMLHPVMEAGEKWKRFYEYVPFLLPLAMGGVVLEIYRRFPDRRTRSLLSNPGLLAFLHLLFGFVFVVLLKPVAWGHNTIELFPWICYFAAVLVGTVFAPASARSTSLRGIALAMVIACLGIGWFSRTPRANRFIERSDLNAIAQFCKSNTKTKDVLVIPEIFALESNRLVATPYIEIAGNITLLEFQVRKNGLWNTYVNSKHQPAEWMNVSADNSIRFSMNFVIQFIQKGQVASVMTFTKTSPASNVRISESLLMDSGYQKAFEHGVYRIWMRRKG